MIYLVTVTDGRGRYALTFRSLPRALDFAFAARRNNRSAVLSCEAL